MMHARTDNCSAWSEDQTNCIVLAPQKLGLMGSLHYFLIVTLFPRKWNPTTATDVYIEASGGNKNLGDIIILAGNAGSFFPHENNALSHLMLTVIAAISSRKFF